jgi:hypothetical protein
MPPVLPIVGTKNEEAESNSGPSERSTAVFPKEPVYVSDILSDGLRDDCRHLMVT